jgi:hypothetical protein
MTPSLDTVSTAYSCPVTYSYESTEDRSCERGAIGILTVTGRAVIDPSKACNFRDAREV